MEDPIRKITLDGIKAAFESTILEIGDFLNVTLDKESKDKLIQVLDKLKYRIKQTDIE